MKTLWAAFAAVIVSASGCAVTGPMSSFHLQEATVADVNAALASGELTCSQLTKLYIDRIEAYNLKGPSLRAILTVNPRALETAAQMDRAYKASDGRMGPLHCIPIILKDNYNTADMPTT